MAPGETECICLQAKYALERDVDSRASKIKQTTAH